MPAKLENDKFFDIITTYVILFEKGSDMTKNTAKKAERMEFNAAVDAAATKKARRGILIFAISTTVVAIASALITADRLMSKICTHSDWSKLDWSIDEDTDEL